MKITRFKVTVTAEAVAKPKNHPTAGNVTRPTNLGLVQAIESYLNGRGYDVEAVTASVVGVEE